MFTRVFLFVPFLPLLLCCPTAASMEHQNPDQVFKSSNPTGNLSDTRQKYRRTTVYVLQETWERSDSYKHIKRKSKQIYKQQFTRKQRNNIEAIFPFMQMVANKEIQYKWEF